MHGLMDPFAPDRDPRKEHQEWRKKLQDLVSYLSHANKQEHLKTAMDLIDANARLESNVATMEADRQKDYPRDGYATTALERPTNIIELPSGTRKVSIEL